MKIFAPHILDGYKCDHRPQFPDKTELVFSNLTPRSTKRLYQIEDNDHKVVFFGLQFFILDFLVQHWNESFFSQPREVVMKKYRRRMDNYLGRDKISIKHIEALWDLGYLPISICALPEGAVVNERVPVFTIYNTKPEFFWLTNYLETVISLYTWKPCVSATIARIYGKLFKRYAIETGADLGFVPFQGHDFSLRGMSGLQDGILSGAGHLLTFNGTDTVPAIDFLEDYYLADSDKELIGCSVPATEHAVMCMGSKEKEIDTFLRLITKVYPTGIVSIVSDTWDFWTVVTKYLPALKDTILARDGKVVIRPDSGDPVKIIAGDSEASLGSIEHKGLIECLWDTFNGTVTSKGFKVLDPHIGAIYGDSITIERAEQILMRLKVKGFASSNIVFGIGSFTYEYVTRDTLGFAMKATAGIVDGEYRAIFKDPKTDNGLKKSAKGFLSVVKNDKGDYILKDDINSLEEALKDSELKEVFRDGKVLVQHSLTEIRQRLAKSND